MTDTGPVTYTEEIRLVPMGFELGPAYVAFERETTRTLRQLIAAGDISGLIPWLMALLIYPDMPWRGWTCKTLRNVNLGTATALSKKTVYPIEKALINYVQEQLARNMPVLVFTENSELLNDQDRLKALFEEHVVLGPGDAPRVAILRNAVHWSQREAWVEQHTGEEAAHVLICDPVRVQGLNLVHFKRVAFKRVPLVRETFCQAARCLYTPGQDVAVETVFFAYEGSMALRLLQWMARGVGEHHHSEHGGMMEIARALFAQMESSADGQ